MSIFYVNGEFVAASEAVVPAADLAVLRGYGVFDYLRTYGGQPFRLHANVQRLRRSADLIGLEYPWTDTQVADLVLTTLKRNEGLASDYNVRIVVTGGVSPDNITPAGKPGLLIMVTPLYELPAWWYEDGVKVVTVDIGRILHGAKSINYIPAIMAQRMARQAGGIEALYRTKDDLITEGTTTNLFAFYGQKLITPGIDILPGITRGVILELAERHYDVDIRDLPYGELLLADEVFITAANKRVVPVVQIDETRIGAGVVGSHVRHMMQLFDAETHKEVVR